MQRRVFLFLALVLCVPAMALASTITAPTGVILTGGPGQVITLQLTGNDEYTDGSFDGVVAAGGPLITAILGKAAPTGAVPAGNLVGTIWAGGAAGTAQYGLNPQASVSTAGAAPQTTAGVYITLTIDSTGVAPGTYNFDISATTLFNGLDLDPESENFLSPIDSANFLTVNGSFLMPVPEPSSVVLGLFAVAGLAAVAIRRRRTA